MQYRTGAYSQSSGAALCHNVIEAQTRFLLRGGGALLRFPQEAASAFSDTRQYVANMLAPFSIHSSRSINSLSWSSVFMCSAKQQTNSSYRHSQAKLRPQNTYFGKVLRVFHPKYMFTEIKSAIRQTEVPQLLC